MEPYVLEFLQNALAVLLPILILGVLALGAIFFKDVKAWIKGRVSEKQWLLIESIISTAIRAAEQTLCLVGNEAKKKFVVDMCTRLFKRYGLQLDPVLLYDLIEGVLAREKMLFGLDYIRTSTAMKQGMTPPQVPNNAIPPSKVPYLN